MIGMFIYWPGWDPGTDTTGWQTIDCGVWAIAGVNRHVYISHPPDNVPKDIEAVLDEAFAEHWEHGQACIKLTEDKSQ
jgi:hypothetical protein